MFTSQLHGSTATWPASRPAVVVRLLGAYAFEFGGHPVAQPTWQRSHARRLIQLLCSAPKCSESRETVLSVLWPGSEEARARNRLHHTVHFIRKAWDEMPAAARPQIAVCSDRVTVMPAPDTLIDVQAFIALSEADLPDAEQQLTGLEQALAMYAGPLADGWDGCALIDGRRAWLASLRETVLREAAATACELGHADRALHHAHQLALLLESDGQAHGRYALLLADNGRADAALLHCQAVRPLIEAEDRVSLAQLDQTIQSIQQRANRVVERVSAPVGARGNSQGNAQGSAQAGTPAIAGRSVGTGLDTNNGLDGGLDVDLNAGTNVGTDNRMNVGPIDGADLCTDVETQKASVSSAYLCNDAPADASPEAGAGAVARQDAAPARPTATAYAVAQAPAPAGPLIGYAMQLDLCLHCLHDPYGALTSVVGPPGSGKSLLAATAALRMQPALRHGVLWVDASQVGDAQDLLQTLSRALTQWFGATGADLASIARALQGKELLVVLDELVVAADSLQLASLIGLAGRDTRWLVTADSACHLRGERLVRIEPQGLLQAPGPGVASPAAQILQRHCVLAAHTQGPRALQPIEQIATVLDGLPLLLEIAGQALTSMSPNELHSRLKRDPLALMRDPQGLGHEAARGAALPAARLTQRVIAWLQPASAQMRDMLYLLGHCRSALTREDIEVLLDNPGSPLVNTLIEQAVRHQWLLRRSARPAAHGVVSEFNVPRIVTAALRLLDDNDELACNRTRIENWLTRGHLAVRTHPAVPVVGTAADTVASHWFNAHVADIDDAVVASLEAGRLDAAAGLCKAHAGHWSLQPHAARLKVWLEGLGDTMDTLDASTAAALLVARARLRVHLGDMHLACKDASRALARVDRDQDAEVSQQALHLLQRYGSANGSREPGRPSSLLQRGVDAGESLLRVAQLAVRHGQLTQALPLCAQALDVFEYFGLANGIVAAHQSRSKIAYALGNTELSLRCLTEAERAAERYDNAREAHRTRLMRADVLLSQMQFSEAIDMASGLMSSPDGHPDPALALRGMATVAWAYYGLGAYRLAQALCKDMRDQVNETRGVAARLNVQILSALIEARCQRPAAALRSASSALDLLMTKRPLSDQQGDLVNTAELAFCLDRPDLARPMLRALSAFSARPEHRLRDWVSARMNLLAGKDWAATLQPAYEEPMASQFDVLTTLTTVPAAL